MKIPLPTLAAMLLVALATAGRAQDDTENGEGFTALSLGDPAPALPAIAAIKGELPGAWEPGQVYVLDFWATWCKPCIESIPHMTAIAEQWADRGVHVIGIAIWPHRGMRPPREFVAESGPLMDYTVAMDVDGLAAAAFMEAAGRTGIPCAIVVDGAGRVAWIGHPMDDLPGVLAEVVTGHFDRVAYERHKQERMERADTLYAQFETAAKAEDWSAVATLSEQLLAIDPTMFSSFAFYHYVALLRLDRSDEAATYGRDAVARTLHASPDDLARLAWLIVDPRGEAPSEGRDLDLALAAAQRADELSRHKDASVLDTLARVHFLAGRLDQAIELQSRALGMSHDDELRSQYQARMDQYLAARDAAADN